MLRAFRLAGPGAEAALDRLHVLGDVRGAVVADDAVTVWIDGPLPEVAFEDVTVSELPPETANAVSSGLEDDRPILVADDLLVRPPWVARPAGFAGVELVVPRGMAFGSGEHASTKAALLALHRTWSAPASLADVGTGSGILALYAATRGTDRIEACDIEAASVAAAAELLPRARVVLGTAALLRPADCVVANMTAAELTASFAELLRLWRERAPLVLSGIRAGEVDAIAARLPRPPQRFVVDEFTALVCPAMRPR